MELVFIKKKIAILYMLMEKFMQECIIWLICIICNEESTNKINDLLLRAARAAKATVLYQHAYHFGEGLGISAIALLAESHISVHTWPEKSYAAFDIFMCGKIDPNLSLNLLKNELKPKKIEVKKIKRGLMN